MGMHLGTGEIVDLLFKYSYAILFPIALFEGPFIAVIAGFMVAINFMSFWPAYLILVSANVVGDVAYYLAGKFIPYKKLIKYLSYIKVTEQKMEKIKNMYLNDRRKAIIFGKVAHGVGAIFLIAAGILGIPFKYYIKTGMAIELPKALLLLAIGYYFGTSVASLTKAVDYSVIIFIIITVVLLIIYFYMKKNTEDKIEKWGNKQL
jgi:membrane protein DedA with SNARE-associated domain